MAIARKNMEQYR